MATKIKLTWPANPASENVTHYEVWESQNGAPFTLKATVTQLFYDITTPAPVNYQWYIKAKNYVGTSAPSAVSSGADIPSAPTAPTVEYINT